VHSADSISVLAGSVLHDNPMGVNGKGFPNEVRTNLIHKFDMGLHDHWVVTNTL
jgi:hypothetical protein